MEAALLNMQNLQEGLMHSDQEYFRSCVAKERQLAHLLGHHQIEENYESAGVLWEQTQRLPQWTRDWQACGPLIARFGLDIHFDPDAQHATLGGTHVRYFDHPSVECALMFGIVKEVIRLLEHPQAQARAPSTR
jgi:hypothetical protein